MRNYEIDIVSLSIESMPPAMRQPLRLAFVRTMLQPLVTLQARFIERVATTRYLLGLSGRVIDLTHFLNDQFDLVPRRIYIEDGVFQAPPILPKLGEPLPLEMPKFGETPPIELPSLADLAAQHDFIVFVPQELMAQVTEILAAIAVFASAGRRYTIKPIP